MVELDANEPPIADGSSREFCKIIQDAGIAPLAEKREPYSPTEPIELQMGETMMTLFPDEAFKITCTSADKQGRFTQFFSTEITPKTWEKELSHARTFCFYEEIEFLIKNGLIKGGSLENAVVIRDDAVLTTEPLRYPEEFVRHKMLDIVGDLSLLGRPIRGHLIAVKPSHAANCELVRHIVAQMQKPLRAAQTFAPPPPKIERARAAGCRGRRDGRRANHEIAAAPPAVPDGGPRSENRRQQNRRRQKRDDERGRIFRGISPDTPSCRVCCNSKRWRRSPGVLLLRQVEAANQVAYFMSAEDVKWRKPVVPGDTLIIEVELTKVARQNRQGQGRLQGRRRNRERGRSHLHAARRVGDLRFTIYDLRMSEQLNTLNRYES